MIRLTPWGEALKYGFPFGVEFGSNVLSTHRYAVCDDSFQRPYPYFSL